jgi:hypothetical protein
VQRSLAAACWLLCAASLLTSCRTTVSLKREVVVVFKPGSTPADRDRVRAACADASPHASPEPVGPGTLKSSRVNDVRYRVDKADDSELAKLYTCLTKDPSVRGVNLPDMG